MRTCQSCGLPVREPGGSVFGICLCRNWGGMRFVVNDIVKVKGCFMSMVVLSFDVATKIYYCKAPAGEISRWYKESDLEAFFPQKETAAQIVQASTPGTKDDYIADLEVEVDRLRAENARLREQAAKERVDYPMHVVNVSPFVTGPQLREMFGMPELSNIPSLPVDGFAPSKTPQMWPDMAPGQATETIKLIPNNCVCGEDFNNGPSLPHKTFCPKYSDEPVVNSIAAITPECPQCHTKPNWFVALVADGVMAKCGSCGWTQSRPCPDHWINPITAVCSKCGKP